MNAGGATAATAATTAVVAAFSILACLSLAIGNLLFTGVAAIMLAAIASVEFWKTPARPAGRFSAQAATATATGAATEADPDPAELEPLEYQTFDPEHLAAELRCALRRSLRRFSPNLPDFGDDQPNWSAGTLRSMIGSELPGADIVVVSNREPYIHNHGPNGIELHMPASGLVSAIEPIMRACGGAWIAHGGGSADRETADSSGRIGAPPGDPSYTLRRIWISEEEQDRYYYGFANEGLWPLCHIAFVRPNFRQGDWRTYRVINQRFARAVAEEARGKNPIVLIQDYHFALLPQMVRELLPEATIITFWHIPWPNAETFGICPWKEEIIRGLLGSSIIGFHTQFHCNNFIETVDRYIESRIDREHDLVSRNGGETLVRPYPISIEWPPAGMARQKSIEECRAAVRARFNLPGDVKLAVGVERFDYTKGIIDRLRAIDVLLTRRPEWRGRFVFIQAAAPSRSKLPAYRDVQEEAVRLAEDINARHAGQGARQNGTSQDGPRPVELVIRHHEPHEVFELFRAADMCVVSSLHDGMNLVAKEFVAARDDNQGVLILSSFAGASRELPEALIINPYYAHDVSSALERALTMTGAEQSARMRLMRERVQQHNVYRWAGQMMLDASRLRKKQRIAHFIAREKAGLRRPA